MKQGSVNIGATPTAMPKEATTLIPPTTPIKAGSAITDNQPTIELR
jgi:hypothetical protein